MPNQQEEKWGVMLLHTEYTEEALTCKQSHLNQPPLYAQNQKST